MTTSASPTGFAESHSFEEKSSLETPWGVREKFFVLLAAITVVFDGMDIQVMGIAIPAIARDWHLERSSFSTTLALGLVGLSLGSVLGGLFGDRSGRRRAILTNVAVFALATLGMSFTHGLLSLMLLRFVAGLGIGGVLPNIAALIAELTPPRSRAAAVTLAIVCIPVGGLIAGLLAARVLPEHSWRVLFLVGGTGPLLMLLILALTLPESPQFLIRVAQARRAKDLSGDHLRGVEPEDLPPAPDSGKSPAWTSLFAGDLRRDTIALWMAFFLCLTTVYLAFNWLPSVMAGAGYGLKKASEGLALYNLGGIVGACACGFWIARDGSRRPMLFCAAGSLGSALIAAWLASGHAGGDVLFLASLCVYGLFTNAVQTTLYALATHVYDTSIRASGVASALGVGRLGAILSATIGGFVLHIATPLYFSLLAVLMVGVTLALALLKRHVPRPA